MRCLKSVQETRWRFYLMFTVTLDAGQPRLVCHCRYHHLDFLLYRRTSKCGRWLYLLETNRVVNKHMFVHHSPCEHTLISQSQWCVMPSCCDGWLAPCFPRCRGIYTTYIRSLSSYFSFVLFFPGELSCSMYLDSELILSHEGLAVPVTDYLHCKTVSKPA